MGSVRIEIPAAAAVFLGEAMKHDGLDYADAFLRARPGETFMFRLTADEASGLWAYARDLADGGYYDHPAYRPEGQTFDQHHARFKTIQTTLRQAERRLLQQVRQSTRP